MMKCCSLDFTTQWSRLLACFRGRSPANGFCVSWAWVRAAIGIAPSRRALLDGAHIASESRQTQELSLRALGQRLGLTRLTHARKGAVQWARVEAARRGQREMRCVLISRPAGATLPHDSATVENDRRVSRLGRRVRFAPDTTVAFRCFERHVCTHDSCCAASKGDSTSAAKVPSRDGCALPSPVLVEPITLQPQSARRHHREIMWSRPRHAHSISISP
jgi:hypothetical protein